MKNIVIAVLAFLVAMLGFVLYFRTSALRQQQQKTQELTAKLDASSGSTNLDLQAACAKQALQQFNDYWTGKKEVDYTNHYNAKMGKCFMRIQYWEDTYSPRDPYFVVQVFDAFEGKQYASYMGELSKSERPPAICSIILSGEEQYCHTQDEFDADVKSYMQ
jgi:hypothetical protein